MLESETSRPNAATFTAVRTSKPTPYSNLDQQQIPVLKKLHVKKYKKNVLRLNSSACQFYVCAYKFQSAAAISLVQNNLLNSYLLVVYN